MISLDRFQKRLDDFQKIPTNDAKRKQNQFVVTLRKNKRLAMINKKRYEISSIYEDSTAESLYLGIPSDTLLMYFPELTTCTSEISKLQIYASVLGSTNIPDFCLVEILKIFRSVLSASSNNPREYFLQYNIIPLICKFISPESDTEIANECIWCLCNIAAGSAEYVDAIYRTGVLDGLLFFLEYSEPNVVENVCWTIANLVEDHDEICKELIAKGFLESLCKFQSFSHKIGCVVAFSLANICKHTKCLSLINVRVILNLLEKLVEHEKSMCLTAVMHLTLGSSDQVELVLENSLMKIIYVELEESTSSALTCVMILGNITSGTHEQTQKLLDNGILSMFHKILSQQDSNVCKYVYWTLSNIAGGTITQVYDLGNHEILIHSIQGLTHNFAEVRNEASIYFTNFLRLACVEHKLKLINSGIFKVLAENFRYNNADCLISCLKISEGLLEVASYVTDCGIIKEFEESGCLKGVQDLTLFHMNDKVSGMAEKIINRYFIE